MKNYLPLSSSQKGIYLSCLEPTLAYNLPLLLKLDEQIKIEDVKEALIKIFEAHNIYQIRLGQEKGEIVQYFEEEPLVISEIKIDKLDKASLVKPFELLNSPLYRIELYETKDGYYLFTDIHHIIFDGFSYAKLYKELGAFLKGKKEINKEKNNLFDYVKEENNQRKSLKNAKKYYEETFGSLDIDSEPVVDKKDDKVSYSRVSYTFTQFSNKLLKSGMDKYGVSRSALFNFIFAYTLATYNGDEEVFYATVNNGRNELVKDAFGMFVKTLPVYFNFTKTDSVKESFQMMDNHLKANLDNSLYSYVDLSTDFGVSSNILFAYQGDYYYEIELNNKAYEVEYLESKDGKEKITFELYRKGENYFVNVEYRSDLYLEDSILHFLKLFEHLTIELLQKNTLKDIDIASDEELKVLDSFNIRDLSIYDFNINIIDMFKEAVNKYPNKDCVVLTSGKAVSYREVDELSDKIAEYILDNGYKKDDVCSILIHRNEYIVIATLGVLKSGLVYQPLDPAYPSERLNFMMKDSGAKLLISEEDLLESVNEYKGPVLLLKNIPNLKGLKHQLPQIKSTDRFTLLYTSGSTGLPKGVQLMHGNLSIFVQRFHKEFNVSSDEKWSAYASYGFDANMLDMFTPICAGATLYVIDEDMRLDLKRMNAYLIENGVTSAFMTTQVARQFTLDYENKTLKRLLCGGEKLVPFTPKGDYPVYNVYGPTECTIYVTEFLVDKLYHRIPIGKGLNTTKLYVLDKNHRRVPYNVSGELYISGPQVGKCYLNRDDQNAIAFLDNPFDQDEKFQRLYKTGDIVRFLKDGTIDFIGRKDSQVKIRGFRIELSEVEAIIRQYPGIKDATVNSYTTPNMGAFIAAFITSDNKVDIDGLKAFIGDNKPAYMIPEVIMQIDKIPLNQNGKVNKRALPKPERKIEDVVKPSNDIEQALFDILKDILGYDTFGVNNDIYYLGLTSIASIKFITLISEKLNKDIDIKTLREAKTIQKLAKIITEERKEENFALQDDYPLTKTQEGIFVESVSHQNSTIYNIPLLYEFSKKVDVDKLVAAIKEAVDVHKYLKGHIFMNDNGDIRIRRNDNLETKVEVIDALSLDKPDVKPEPFDLLKDDLYRIKIYLCKNNNYLFIDTHHIASDGTSLAILFEDINKAYNGEVLEEEKMNGFDYALLEEKESTKEELEKQKAYYASFLDGVDCNSVPRKEYNLPSEEKMMTYDYYFDPHFEDLNKFNQEHHLSNNVFFNAVFAFTLAKFNGLEDSLYVTIYNGRNSIKLARSVVMLVKTLPIYTKYDKDEKVIDYISRMKDQIIESEEKTLYSFADIAKDFGVKSDVMFAYQGDGLLKDELANEKVNKILFDSDDAKSMFSIDASEENGKIKLHFEYISNLYLEETMKYFSYLFENISLEFLSKEKIKDVDFVDEIREKEMDFCNETDDKLPGKSYVDLFLKAAKDNPEKLAVAAIDEDITYKELDRRSNQVANAILEKGLNKDDIVILIMPRIANAYSATQGVLKSGAAYLPIDPNYPDERITYICEDSGAKLIITTKELFNAKIKNYNIETLLIEDILASKDDTYHPVEIDPHQLAYSIYTSGSTGKPKGVLIEHHSLHNYVSYTPHNMVAKEFVDQASVSLSLASLSFDLSVQEQMVPLANGLSVVLASEDEILNPLVLSKRMKKYGVDIMSTTPSYVNNVLDIDEVVDVLKNINVLDIGAEALPVSLIRKMKEVGLKWEIHNGYGPTEATVACTMDYVDSERVTIGFPLANYKAYIVDTNTKRLSFGMVGELLIAGEGVARGYKNRDDLTKEKFITFKGYPAYKTGDLARLNYDGRIEFFGRKDNQVKLRGLRVELDEIENQINRYPGVNRSVVLVKENPEEGQFLVAYVASKTKLDFDDLRKEISKTLTPYMIPKIFIQIDEIPLTNNGKVDKKALPEPEVKHETTAKKPPTNKNQETLYKLFEKVLGISDFSIDDDFFSLGGTSLSASKLTMLMMKEGFNIAYSDIFDYPTIVALDAFLRASEKVSVATETIVEEELVRKALENNKVELVSGINNEFKFNSVLLLGATGFLGMHVLRELIVRDDIKIYIFVRKGKDITALERVKGMFAYYFDDPFEDAFKEKVSVIEGDITDTDLIEKVKDIDFDLIINCAAVVKHFAKDDSIERVNYGGVKNLIEVAKHYHKRLIQISTLSVAGENINDKFPDSKKIHEYECYFGQDVSNKYVNSKIKAEEAILTAIEEEGLDAKIIRVGNLMGRQSDGEFQINALTNNFMKSLKAYAALKVFPIDMADETIDFSPIDEVAKTILLFATTPSKYTIFHSANSHEVEMGNVISAMNESGFEIEMVNMDLFQEKLNEFIADEEKSEKVASLLNYENSDKTRISKFILSDNTFSIKALYRLGYKWPITNEDYILNMIMALETLGYFDL